MTEKQEGDSFRNPPAEISAGEHDLDAWERGLEENAQRGDEEAQRLLDEYRAAKNGERGKLNEFFAGVAKNADVHVSKLAEGLPKTIFKGTVAGGKFKNSYKTKSE